MRGHLRVSLFGGGTDNPEYVKRYGKSCVLGGSIDLTTDDGPVFAGRGLGYSSAYEYSRGPGGWYDAWLRERAGGSYVGWQDAWFAAGPGFGLVEFDGSPDPVWTPLTVDWLAEWALLTPVGGPRPAAFYEVVSTAPSPIDTTAREALGRLSDPEGFCALLRAAWVRKRDRGVSSPVVDVAVGVALHAGAKACKLLGAGGSGFLLSLVPPDRRAAVVAVVGPEQPFEYTRCAQMPANCSGRC